MPRPTTEPTPSSSTKVEPHLNPNSTTQLCFSKRLNITEQIPYDLDFQSHWQRLGYLTTHASEGNKANHRKSGSSISPISHGLHTHPHGSSIRSVCISLDPKPWSAATALADMHIPKRHLHPTGKCLKGAIQRKHTLNWSSPNLHPPYDAALPTTGLPALSLLHASGTATSRF